MAFTVSQKTLQRLEWDRVLEELRGRLRTPVGMARLEPPGGLPALFEASRSGMLERLAETGEARAVLANGDRPPLAGVASLGETLDRARKGGSLSPHALQELGASLDALRATQRFLAQRSELAPRLASLAEVLSDQSELRDALERCLEPSGELRDSASPALAEARREARRRAGEIQERLSRALASPSTLAHLSDTYYTLRNDRYVLPVRSDARSQVPGIVHGASRTGTTLFVEPEALVELNNRHKQAEIAIEQETRRVLRWLSQLVMGAADALEADLEAIAAVDLAFARADLSDSLDASVPTVGEEGVLWLPQLRHPALPRDEAVANDVELGRDLLVLVLSGPNAGGKTVTMKAVALAVLFARAGLHVPAGRGARVDAFDAVLADIGDEQDIREHLSTFSAHMANIARIVEQATPHSLVVLDEVGVGTDPGEGAALAQSVLEALADTGARVIVTTHFNLLKEIAEVDVRFANASVEFDPETLAPTYQLRAGLPGRSSATAVAARMGMPGNVLERANALLDREDRRLDRMLGELAASRAGERAAGGGAPPRGVRDGSRRVHHPTREADPTSRRALPPHAWRPRPGLPRGPRPGGGSNPGSPAGWYGAGRGARARNPRAPGAGHAEGRGRNRRDLGPTEAQ